MFYAISWFAVCSLLTLWSLAAWALHAVAVWTVSNAGVVTGAASAVDSLHLPQWLAPWVPPQIAQAVASLLAGLGPAVESLLQSAPALAAGLTVASWVVWGVGCLLLLALGAGLHLLIAMGRRHAGQPGSTRVMSAN